MQYKVKKTETIHYRYREAGEVIDLPTNIALRYVLENIIEPLETENTEEEIQEEAPVKTEEAPTKKGGKK